MRANSDNFGFRPTAIYARAEFMSRWNYYEPNRNEKDRGQTLRSRAKFAGWNERGSPHRGANVRRLSSFYCSQIECRFSTATRRKSKEVEIGGPFSALDLLECIRLCHVVTVEAFLTRSYNHETLLTMENPISRSTPHTPLRLPFPLYDAGTHERVLGAPLYLHGDTQARVYVRAHALPQPSL